MSLNAGPDEISPITGKKTVYVDVDSATGLVSKLCMETGYTTNSFMEEGSKTVSDLQKSIPKVAYENRIVDNYGKVWIPMMQRSNGAVIFPSSEGGDLSFYWSVCPIKKLSEEDAKKYPDPDNEGQFMDAYVDFQGELRFEFGDFENAFDKYAEWSNLAVKEEELSDD